MECKKCGQNSLVKYYKKEIKDGFTGIVPVAQCKNPDCGDIWRGDWRNKKQERKNYLLNKYRKLLEKDL